MKKEKKKSNHSKQRVECERKKGRGFWAINISQTDSGVVHNLTYSLPFCASIFLSLVSFRSWFLFSRSMLFNSSPQFQTLRSLIYCIFFAPICNISGPVDLSSSVFFLSEFWDLILYFAASFALIWLGICLFVFVIYVWTDLL